MFLNGSTLLCVMLVSYMFFYFRVDFLKKKQHSLNVEFLKPTAKKLLIAFILTLWPYIASLIFLLHANEGNIFTDKMVQFSYWEHTWHWSPLYLIIQFFPNAVYNNFWQSNFFLFFLYPLVRFSLRYIVVCVVVSFANKFSKKQRKVPAENH